MSRVEICSSFISFYALIWHTSILHCIIFRIYLLENAAIVRVQIRNRTSWDVDYVLRNSIFNTFWNESKCLKYKWWSVSINISKVTRSWEMSERFTRWAFSGMCAGMGTGWELGVHIWCVSLGYHGHQHSTALRKPPYSIFLWLSPVQTWPGKWRGHRREQMDWNSRDRRPTGNWTSPSYFCCFLSPGNR